MKSNELRSTVVLILALVACGPSPSSTSSSLVDVTYAMTRQYTGMLSNTLVIDVPEGTGDGFLFSVASAGATANVAMATMHPLESQSIQFAYVTEGIHAVDFKVEQKNGTPYVFEILTWEYSTEIPVPPIISFTKRVTRSLSNNLLVSDSRSSNTSEIWVGGDVSTAGKRTIDGGGFWEDLPTTGLAVPVTLSAGDGVKYVHAKFRNLFGNVSDPAIPADILLKQTPPTQCAVQVQSAIVADNQASLKLTATDPYPLSYSVFGDVGAVVSQKAFTSGDVVSVFVEPTPGTKRLVVSIEDIAGNVCLNEEVLVTLDPAVEGEGIYVRDHPYWTNSENILVDAYFDHFADQEPLQLKITGDVSGANTNTWIPYATGVTMSLNPSSSGSRRIFAQYKDAYGVESYLVAKRIYLKPEVTIAANVLTLSPIPGTSSVSIVGCTESYTGVAYATNYACQKIAPTVDVTYTFDNASTLTLSTP